MSILSDTIQVGFEELTGYAETTARFGEIDYPCIQGETQELANLVLGGLDEELDGILVFSKSDFSGGIPKIGTQFLYDNQFLRVEVITTDLIDPTFTVAFSKIKVQQGVPRGSGDPSIPCLYLDGGTPDHGCEAIIDGGEVDHDC